MNSRKLQLLLIGFAIFLIAGGSANRLGYLMTDFSFGIRAYVIFPIFMVAWYTWIFGFKWDAKWSATGKRMTTHEFNLQNFPGTKGHIKMIVVYVVGFPALLGYLAWSAIGIPAYLAKFSAKEPFAQEYFYTPDAPFIAEGYKFQDVTTNENVSVRRIVRLYRDFPEEISSAHRGEIVCLQGRTSVFGTIVQKIKPGQCSDTLPFFTRHAL